MRKMRRIALSLVLAVLMLFGLVGSALATNPTVTITISAQITSITNTQNTWTIGAVVAGASAIKWGTSDTYSQVENTGNVAVDVLIKGTNFVDTNDGSHNWTLATAAGDKAYSLYANTDHAGTYTIELTVSGNNLTTNLAATGSDKWTWSMQLTPPTVFDAADDGDSKTATVTLVASKHV